MNDYVLKYLQSFQNDFYHFIKKSNKEIIIAADLISRSFKKNKKLLVCGNGGSASDAQHFAAELVGRFKKERASLPAIALNTDTSAITAIANDYDYRMIFSRQIEGLGCKGDILLAISTSGKSRNIKEAIVTAKKNNITTIGLTGKKMSVVSRESDLCISVPSIETSHIQELHIIVLHLLCILIEKKLTDAQKNT